MRRRPHEGAKAWRRRLHDALWFGRSVRTQILIVLVLVNLVAAAIAGGVVIFKAAAATRIEIAASMRLAELMIGEGVQLIQQGLPADQFLKSLPVQLRSVRHVRVSIRDAAGTPVADAGRDDVRPPAPAWFAALVGPQVERYDIPVVLDGKPLGTVEIVSAPSDEIAEAWENSVALAVVAAVTVLVVIGILYFVLGRVLDPLTGLGDGLRGLERRDYKVRLARPKVLEFAAITDRFNALAGALDDARAENLTLSRRLITAQDDERRRTAMDLHDEVGPSLFGLKANLASIARVVDALPEPAARSVAERVHDLSGIIGHLQGINRGILNRLRPMALGHVPLRDILAELVDDRARLHAEITFTGRFEKLRTSYGDTVDLTLYRCVQESLTNAVRHAGARNVAVVVGERHDAAASSSAAPRLELTVHDDGIGIGAGIPYGFGLRGMQERVQALGGEFSVMPAAGAGTCVRVGISVAGGYDDGASPGPDVP